MYVPKFRGVGGGDPALITKVTFWALQVACWKAREPTKTGGAVVLIWKSLHRRFAALFRPRRAGWIGAAC